MCLYNVFEIPALSSIINVFERHVVSNMNNDMLERPVVLNIINMFEIYWFFKKLYHQCA